MNAFILVLAIIPAFGLWLIFEHERQTRRLDRMARERIAKRRGF
jgi:hypothetical protein